MNEKLRILFIEDNEFIAQLIIHYILKKYNVKLDHIISCLDFEDIYKKNSYDLIISDFHFVDGEITDSLIKYINYENDIKLKKKPVIYVLTGNIYTEFCEQILNRVKKVLEKPIEFKTIDEIIKKCLN